jgi:2-octaprenyl-6-methoxyphenol hydroxylase
MRMAPRRAAPRPKSPVKRSEIEVLILGAGPVGLTLAVALAGAGVKVTAIDRADPTQAVIDGRTTAVSASSQRVYAATGVWAGLSSGACPIHDIRVTDGDAPLFLHFDHRDLDQGPLGWILDNASLRRALLARARALPGFTLLAPVELARIERGDTRVRAELEGGGAIEAALVIGADGRNSRLRQEAGISATQWRYPQTAIACIAAHQHPHGNIAHERFLPNGPFAMLPMLDDARGRHRSSIVWTERAELVPGLLTLPKEEFDAELAERFGDFLGAVEVAGGRFAHPLGLLHADRYVAERLALVGDAAHAIHPVAGQGFNLGVRDAAALAEVLVDARRLGLDLGASAVLADYQRWRRFDALALAAMTDGLVRLFGARDPALRLARDLGLAAVQRLPRLKRFFMRQAMGLAGARPRLLLGEAL